jgi:hypothetical protein
MAIAGDGKKLLTAAEVGKILRVSTSEVYRRSKGDLKSAAVLLGPGPSGRLEERRAAGASARRAALDIDRTLPDFPGPE